MKTKYYMNIDFLKEKQEELDTAKFLNKGLVFAVHCDHITITISFFYFYFHNTFHRVSQGSVFRMAFILYKRKDQTLYKSLEKFK